MNGSGQHMHASWRTLYFSLSLCLSVVFAIVGLIFLFVPDNVFLFFNTVAKQLGFPETGLQGFGLYQVLAVGYMYLVSLLAYFMYANPENVFFPLLLVNGKAASSLISLFLFFFHGTSFLLLTNGIVDGMIAGGVFMVYRKSRGAQP